MEVFVMHEYRKEGAGRLFFGGLSHNTGGKRGLREHIYMQNLVQLGPHP